MIKAVFALIVAGLSAAVMVLPAPESPAPHAAAAVAIPSVSICPVEEGGGRSTAVGVVSSVSGHGQLTAFAGGSVAGSSAFETDSSGAAAVPVGDVAAVGVAGGLVELPTEESASASFLTGTDSVAHEVCPITPVAQALLAGGYTTGDQEFDIQLMNPYSGEAVVDLVVRSESGVESASQLRGVAVPARSSVLVDMDEILPGRESLAVAIEVVSGSALAVGRIITTADVALWNAVAPAQDWFIPVPSGGLGEIVISTGVASEVEYQVDVYGPDGLVEAFADGVVPANGDVDIDVEIAGTEAAAFRVVSTQPVGVFSRMAGEEGAIALTSASPVAASRWLLPGAGMGAPGSGRLVVLNNSLEQTNVVITAVGGSVTVKQPPVRAGSVLEFAGIVDQAVGYTVTGDGSFVPMWVTSSGSGVAYTLGVPLIDE